MPPEDPTARAPLILSFDSSAARCTVALLRGDAVLAHVHEDMARGQAERLFPLIEEVLARAGRHWRDLDAIGVGTGPGNFTGTRIAVSAARGLALALGVPAVGVTLFDALAEGSGARPLVASVAATHGALYVQEFTASGREPPRTVTLDDLRCGPFAAPVAVIGAEAEHIAARIGGTAATPRYPLAEAIGRIALRRYANAAARPAPVYMRPAAAAPPREAPPTRLP